MASFLGHQSHSLALVLVLVDPLSQAARVDLLLVGWLATFHWCCLVGVIRHHDGTCIMLLLVVAVADASGAGAHLSKQHICVMQQQLCVFM